MIKILNFVILNTKVYINNKKGMKNHLNLYEFKNKLRQTGNIEEFRMTNGQLLQQM